MDVLSAESLYLDLEERDGADPMLDCTRVFGNSNPVEIELGIGKGRYLIDAAQQHPSLNYIGVEWAGKYLRIAHARCSKRNLSNVRLVRADAREFVEFFIRAESVRAYHLYFPDPWPKKRHHKRRLFNDGFVTEVVRTLLPGGLLWLVTDHDDYFQAMREVLDRFHSLRETSLAWEGVRSNYEDKFLALGKKINRRVFEKV